VLCHRVLVVGLLLALIGGPTVAPATGQEPPAGAEGTEAPAPVGMTDEEIEAAGFVEGQYQIHDVPYAMRVNTLFGAIVHWEAMDSWWENHGFDAASPAVEELRALAAEVDKAHPIRRRAETSNGKLSDDVEVANARMRTRLDERYRALGVALGQWLENRRAEGYPPEFFLDRLVAGVGVTAFSSESMESVRSEVARNAAEFEAGLRETMETVPLQLTAPREEDQ
jgi:hypothetical protein